MWKALAGLVVGVLVLWCLKRIGATVDGWPAVALLALCAFWEQLAAILHSLAEWVEIQWGDKMIRRAREHAEERLDEAEETLAQTRLEGSDARVIEESTHARS